MCSKLFHWRGLVSKNYHLRANQLFVPCSNCAPQLQNASHLQSKHNNQSTVPNNHCLLVPNEHQFAISNQQQLLLWLQWDQFHLQCDSLLWGWQVMTRANFITLSQVNYGSINYILSSWIGTWKYENTTKLSKSWTVRSCWTQIIQFDY